VTTKWLKCGAKVWGSARILPICSVITKAIAGRQCTWALHHRGADCRLLGANANQWRPVNFITTI